MVQRIISCCICASAFYFLQYETPKQHLVRPAARDQHGMITTRLLVLGLHNASKRVETTLSRGLAVRPRLPDLRQILRLRQLLHGGDPERWTGTRTDAASASMITVPATRQRTWLHTSTVAMVSFSNLTFPEHQCCTVCCRARHIQDVCYTGPAQAYLQAATQERGAAVLPGLLKLLEMQVHEDQATHPCSLHLPLQQATWALTRIAWCSYASGAACGVPASGALCMRSRHPLSRSFWRQWCKHVLVQHLRRLEGRACPASQPCQMACQKPHMPQPPNHAQYVSACSRASMRRAARARRPRSSLRPCAAQTATARTGCPWRAALRQPLRQLSGEPLVVA